MRPRTLTILTAVFVLQRYLALLTSAGSVAKGAAPGAVPSGGTVPYSGQLSDDTGQPVADGDYAFRFELYDTAQGGKLLWSETQSGVAVTGGAFTAQLGSITTLPEEAQVKNGWLEVSVRGPEETSFTMLNPRQAINTAVSAAPASPAAAASCAHNHFGEVWAGNGSGTDAAGGLSVRDHATDGTGLDGRANNGTNAWGVNGESSEGFGVRGYSYSGFAFAADGNAAQKRDAGGWVKAMARVSGTNITRCYNSQTTGTAIYTPPCGITSTGAIGTYDLDFGFQVNDRFFTITPEWSGITGPTDVGVRYFLNDHTVTVTVYPDFAFYIIVY